VDVHIMQERNDNLRIDPEMPLVETIAYKIWQATRWVLTYEAFLGNELYPERQVEYIHKVYRKDRLFVPRMTVIESRDGVINKDKYIDAAREFGYEEYCTARIHTGLRDYLLKHKECTQVHSTPLFIGDTPSPAFVKTLQLMASKYQSCRCHVPSAYVIACTVKHVENLMVMARVGVTDRKTAKLPLFQNPGGLSGSDPSRKTSTA
jgi:hypothetical protein